MSEEILQRTLKKFGFPNTLISEYEHWILLLRPHQVTLGSLVLFEKSGEARIGDVSPESFQEFAKVTGEIETLLNAVIPFEKINYLALMMKDPVVHFHIIPRYEGKREFKGVSVTDHSWPDPPDLKQGKVLDENEQKELAKFLNVAFKQ